MDRSFEWAVAFLGNYLNLFKTDLTENYIALELNEQLINLLNRFSINFFENQKIFSLKINQKDSSVDKYDVFGIIEYIKNTKRFDSASQMFIDYLKILKFKESMGINTPMLEASYDTLETSEEEIENPIIKIIKDYELFIHAYRLFIKRFREEAKLVIPYVLRLYQNDFQGYIEHNNISYTFNALNNTFLPNGTINTLILLKEKLDPPEILWENFDIEHPHSFAIFIDHHMNLYLGRLQCQKDDYSLPLTNLKKVTNEYVEKLRAGYLTGLSPLEKLETIHAQPDMVAAQTNVDNVLSSPMATAEYMMNIRRINFEQWLDLEQQAPITVLLNYLIAKVKMIKEDNCELALINDIFAPLITANRGHLLKLEKRFTTLKEYIYRSADSSVANTENNDKVIQKKELSAPINKKGLPF